MGEYSTQLDVAYSNATSPRQALDLLLPVNSDATSPLLVYIHGGAWRSDAKEDFRSTMITNLLLQSGLPVACLEYRLAPDDPHPSQALDVLSGLSLLTGPLLPLEHSTPRWDRSKLYLIGHSVGAFIATSIILNSPFPNPSFIVPPTLRSCIKGVVCVDGIYDLPELLDEYPSYDFFVNLAFGKDPLVFIYESPARWDLPVESEDVRWLVLHSREDELLSLRQPEVFVKRMKEVGGEGRLEVDYESVKGEHEAVWKEEILPRVIVEWVRKLEGMK